MPKKRRRYSFLLVFFIVVALIIAFVLSSGLFFKVKEILVEGTAAYTEQEVAALSGIHSGDNIFLINKISAARSILAKLPYIKKVRISRDLPGTVIIHLTESAPAGMIENRGLYWLFDTQGTLLESVAVLTPPKLPVVRGVTLSSPLSGDEINFPDEHKAKREPMLELLRALQTHELWEGVSDVDVTQLSNLRFTHEVCKVELGTPDMIERKLQTMVLALEQIEGPGTLYLAPVADGQPSRFVPDAR
ncbi:MAG: FtsQ-type POTRA domain-containing protein [Oscillospiraceae bacterium]|jgi:outer membrane protein assembly factor BamA|nr:FtsQ-type POTRA domain-containing protein [Oscillospiraceae bacterium]